MGNWGYFTLLIGAPSLHLQLVGAHLVTYYKSPSSHQNVGTNINQSAGQLPAGATALKIFEEENNRNSHDMVANACYFQLDVNVLFLSCSGNDW